MRRRPSGLVTLIVGLSLLLAGAAAGQTLGLGAGTTGQKSLPVQISSEQGIEWRQAQHVYIARGNAKAVRGTVTVYADELRAYYRPTAKNLAAKTVAAKNLAAKTLAAKATGSAMAPPRKPSKKPDVDLDEGATEVYRLEAIGHVRFVTPTETAFGDHADYDVDTARLVMTGQHLRAVTPRDTLTARDSLEWYDKRQLGVARGHAIDLHGAKTIMGDVLTATFVHTKGQPSHVSRIDANGNVFISSKDQIGRGDTGVYIAATGIVTLSGHVRLTRGKSELRGAYGVMDMNRNVGRLLPAPPGVRRAAASPLRVEGLLVPTPAPAAKPGTKAARKPHHPDRGTAAKPAS